MELVGKKFKSNSCNEFTVIRKTNERLGWTPLYEIEFDEINNVKYRDIVRKDYITRKCVVNPFFPRVYGIGYIGNATTVGNELQYNRWKNMISRCYNPKSEKYSSYGAAGVTVCDRWLCFENFLDDFRRIEGYDAENISNLVLDKDIKFAGNKVYSPDNCMFVSASENSKEMRDRRSPWFIAISPQGEVFESNNQREFAKAHDLTHIGINDTLLGRQKTHREWRFEYKIMS